MRATRNHSRLSSRAYILRNDSRSQQTENMTSLHQTQGTGLTSIPLRHETKEDTQANTQISRPLDQPQYWRKFFEDDSQNRQSKSYKFARKFVLQSSYAKLKSANSSFEMPGQTKSKKISRRKCIVRNTSKWYSLWEIVDLCVFLFHFGMNIDFVIEKKIVLPFCFKTADILIHLVYLLDIILLFRKAFYNKEGDQIFRQAAVCRRKFNTPSFYFDLITCLPLPVIFWDIQIHLYLRLLLLFRVHKLVHWVHVLNCKVRMKNIMKVCTYIIVLLALCLTLASLWILNVCSECVWYPLDNQHPDSVNPFCLGSSRAKQFLQSIVYTIIMLVSQGQAFPQTEMQLVLSSGFLLTGSFVNAILFGVVVNSIEQAKARQNKFNSNYDEMVEPIRCFNLPKHKFRIFRHQVYGNTLAALQLQEFTDFLSYLTPSLRQKVFYDLLNQKFSNCIFWERKSRIQNIAFSISLSLKLPEEVIFEYNSESDGIYFLLRGQVDLFQPSKKRSLKFIKSLRAGHYFGQVGTLLNTTRSLKAQSSKNYSTLAFLPSQSIRSYLESNRRQVKVIEKTILRYNDRFCAYVRDALSKAQIWDDSRSELELFKFRVREYKAHDYLWKPGQLPQGLMIVLSGCVTFQISMGGLMMPIELVERKQVIGLQHCMENLPHQCFAHAETRVKVAIYPLQQFQQLMARRAGQANWITREARMIRYSYARPFPLDQQITDICKKDRPLFIFKNVVITVMRSLRRNRYQNFLINLRKNLTREQIQERKAKRHRQFIRNSLRFKNYVQLGGRDSTESSLTDCSDILESQYYLGSK